MAEWQTGLWDTVPVHRVELALWGEASTCSRSSQMTADADRPVARWAFMQFAWRHGDSAVLESHDGADKRVAQQQHVRAHASDAIGSPGRRRGRRWVMLGLAGWEEAGKQALSSQQLRQQAARLASSCAVSHPPKLLHPTCMLQQQQQHRPAPRRSVCCTSRPQHARDHGHGHARQAPAIDTARARFFWC